MIRVIFMISFLCSVIYTILLYNWQKTSLAPVDRKTSIERMVYLARFNDDPFLKNFGITLNTQMVDIEGRVLQAPGIVYSDNKKVCYSI